MRRFWKMGSPWPTKVWENPCSKPCRHVVWSKMAYFCTTYRIQIGMYHCLIFFCCSVLRKWNNETMYSFTKNGALKTAFSITLPVNRYFQLQVVMAYLSETYIWYMKTYLPIQSRALNENRHSACHSLTGWITHCLIFSTDVISPFYQENVETPLNDRVEHMAKGECWPLNVLS